MPARSGSVFVSLSLVLCPVALGDHVKGDNVVMRPRVGKGNLGFPLSLVLFLRADEDLTGRARYALLPSLTFVLTYDVARFFKQASNP